jgi:hypothetical protein
MELKMDPDAFEKQQEILVEELINNIRVKVQEAGLTGLEMENLTANIAFSVTSTIDDMTGIESDGDHIHPYLTFRNEDDDLIHDGENSYTYEFVTPVLKRVFG